jgi:hypothetical protein
MNAGISLFTKTRNIWGLKMWMLHPITNHLMGKMKPVDGHGVVPLKLQANPYLKIKRGK